MTPTVGGVDESLRSALISHLQAGCLAIQKVSDSSGLGGFTLEPGTVTSLCHLGFGCSQGRVLPVVSAA